MHQRRPDLAAVTPQPAAPKEEPVLDRTPSVDPVKERILALVVEKTGYPKDMLDLDLDLEADLGVDTVKQAEMFAAIREIYGIPRDDNRKLRDYPTLAHVVRFVHDKRPDLAVGAAVPQTVVDEPVISAVPVGPAADSSIRDKVLAIVAEKTGYPKDMLDLDLDLEADLGIDTVKQAEMFASVRAAFDIPRDRDLKLRDFPTLAHVIKFAEDRRQAPLDDRPAENSMLATAFVNSLASESRGPQCCEPYSASRSGPYPPSAADHLQADRCCSRPRQSRGYYARPGWCC